MGKIKSDGGHSSYYDIPLGDEQLKSIAEINRVSFNDLIDAAFGGDDKFVAMVTGLHCAFCGDAFRASNKMFGLTQEQATRALETNTLKIDDLIYFGFGNDFDYGTILKSLKRAYEAMNGRGKEGADVVYNLKKVLYSMDQICKWTNRNPFVHSRTVIDGWIKDYS